MNNNLDIENFLEMIVVEKNATQNTISSYRADLSLLSKFLSQKILRDADFDDLNSYIFNLNKQSYSPETITRKIVTLRQFYKFLYLEKSININPTLNLELPKKSKKLPKYLSSDEITLIFNTIEKDQSTSSIRIYTILEILYASGMRISELIGLTLSDIKPLLDGKQYIIITGKGRKQRVVAFSERAINAIKEYLKMHDEKSKWLFPGDNRGKKANSKQDTHVTRQRLGQIFKDLAFKSGIASERLSPHVIRHSFATHLLNNGIDIKIVQDLLGHSSIATTEIYTHIPSDTLKAIVLKNHPLNQLLPVKIKNN